MRHLSAESTLALSVSLLALGLAAAGAEVVTRSFEDRVEEVGEGVLRSAAEAFATLQRAEEEKLAATLDALMASDQLRVAFQARDRGRLLALAAPVLQTLRDRDGITHWYFHEPEPSRRVFLRVHKPDLFGERVERATLARAADTGDLGAGLELGRTAFALRVVRPWVHDGQVIGYLELAERIDHFLEAMKRRTGDDYGLLVKKRLIDEQAWASVLRPLANSWNGRPDVLAINSTAIAEGILDYAGDLDRLGEGGDLLGEAIIGGRAYLRGVFPVRDAAGRAVGGLFVAHDFTVHHAAVQEARRTTFALLLGLAALAAFGFAVLARLFVFRRIRWLRERLERRTAGWAPGGRAGAMTGHDDLSRLETLFERALSEEAAAAGGRPAGPGVATGEPPPPRTP
jgi:hypothetical protein